MSRSLLKQLGISNFYLKLWLVFLFLLLWSRRFCYDLFGSSKTEQERESSKKFAVQSIVKSSMELLLLLLDGQEGGGGRGLLAGYQRHPESSWRYFDYYDNRPYIDDRPVHSKLSFLMATLGSILQEIPAGYLGRQNKKPRGLLASHLNWKESGTRPTTIASLFKLYNTGNDDS